MILHVQAIEACNLPDMDIIGKSDPYLKFKFDFSNKIWKTQYKNNTDSPVWNETFHFPVSNLTDKLCIELYDQDTISKDDLISSMTFQMSDFRINETVDKWYLFTPIEGLKHGGKVHLIFRLESR